MTLKTKELTQGTTEMFISEFEKEVKSLQCNVRNIQKTAMRKKQVSKDFLNYLRWIGN